MARAGAHVLRSCAEGNVRMSRLGAWAEGFLGRPDTLEVRMLAAGAGGGFERVPLVGPAGTLRDQGMDGSPAVEEVSSVPVYSL